MKRFNIKIAGLALLASFGFASCSDAFLEEKMNYDQAGPEIYNDYAGALGRLSDIYGLCLPDPNGNPGWQYPSTGFADDLSKCTEEYSGYGVFVNPKKELNTVGAPGSQPDYFLGDASNVRNNPWGLIRDINDAMIGIEGSTGLTQEQKNECLGQLYFFRAWRYFLMVKWYGGVPIIKDCPPIESSSITPRSSAKECFNFIVEDLDKAADLLEPFTGKGQWRSGDNYGRVTTAAALALKGRVLTWWCSPLFNRENDVERYKAAYEMMKADYERIKAGGYGLYKPNGDSHGLSDWGKMFNVVAGSEEGVFVARFNTLASGTPDYHRNNPTDQKSRPKNALGGGGITPSAMIVDLFPMADGRPPQGYSTKLQGSSLDYNPNYPFLHRDMRFYRTFGFPGIYWRFNGDPTDTEKKMNIFKGDVYELWNYVWYPKADQVSKNTGSNELGADNLLGDVKGMYVMKRSTSDAKASHYRYLGVSAGEAGFQYSAQTYYEIRFAEVMLNLAEVACGAGEMEAAVENYLKPIRKRAGYNYVPDNYQPLTSDKASTYVKADLGIDPAAKTSADVCMAQIMYERQIELAFEGKRFDDMRRWLLFDGGAGFETGFPAAWKLTGWDGNTCDYLGVKPLNGQRRENMVFQVKPTIDSGLGGGVGGKEWAQGKWNESPDALYLYFKAQADVGKTPIRDAAGGKDADKCLAIKDQWAKILEEKGIVMEGPAMAIMECFLTSKKTTNTRGDAEDAYWQAFQDWRTKLAVELDANARRDQSGNKNIDYKINELYTKFYQPFLQRKLKYGDGLSDNNTIDETTVVTFLPRYYMLGLTSGAQNRNETLEQTYGWADYFGGEGGFDPLFDENPGMNLPEVMDNPVVEDSAPETGELE